MRTNERGYSQAIGAHDPDKKDNLHNMACRFLAREESFKRIVGLVGLDMDGYYSHVAKLSEPINKYTYKNIANLFGFADLIIQVFFEKASCDYMDNTGNFFSLEQRDTKQILIEVKSRPVDTLDCIQQIKSYLSVWPMCTNFAGRIWVPIENLERSKYDAQHKISTASCLLVTLYKISVEDKNLLLENGIHHVYLEEAKILAHYKNNKLDDSEQF